MLDVIPAIVKLRDHARQRLRRMELLALGGRVADFNVFGHRRSYQVGRRDAADEVVQILNDELARHGLQVIEPAEDPADPDPNVAYLEERQLDDFHPLPFSNN